MRKDTFFFFLMFTLTLPAWSQRAPRDNWIDFGSSHSSKYLQFAAGKMGPNALPVPRMDYAVIGNKSAIETGAQYHQMTGDTSINSFLNIQWVIAPRRAKVEIWGQPSETFRMSNEVRDFRQVSFDDTGWITEAGDLWISTHIQVLREQKYLPDVVINYTTKTTTGSNRHARYTDANLNYFYFALGKSVHFQKTFIDEIRLAGLLGFYVWQTNKVEMAQDEGPVFNMGIQFRKDHYSLYTEFGGYTGYDAYNFLNRIYGEGTIKGYNDPLVMRFRLERMGERIGFSTAYQFGFRDYAYQTFHLNVQYRFQSKQR
jgi:hypothetical protein